MPRGPKLPGPLETVRKLDDCKAMSGTPWPLGLHKLDSKNGLGQATGANALVEAFIPPAKYIEEIDHLSVLVVFVLVVTTHY
jgi:hypothetical protein